jgi:GNAT superfamily N-acetyltransferase
MSVIYEWRGEFENTEVNALHSEAFATRLYSDDEWDWQELVARHSLGWVVAREGARLVGFVNVLWDGFTHAWLQDTMVAAPSRHGGIGTAMIAMARTQCRNAGCQWLHVDFDEDLAEFYFVACGFRPTTSGIMQLDGT